MCMCIYVRLLHQYSVTSVLRGSINYYYCIASQIKCGSCDSALGGSGRGLGGGGELF